jgi:hypothetical protein
VGFGLGRSKCSIFQLGLTDSLSARFGGGFFRHYTLLLCIPLLESTAKTIGGAVKAVAVSPLIAAKAVAFGSGFGGWILRGRPGVTLPALRAAIRLPGARSGQRVRQLPELLEASVRGHAAMRRCTLGGWPRMFAVLKHWRDRRGQARHNALMAKYWS